MNAGILQRSRRWLVNVTLATALAVLATYGQVIASDLLGILLTSIVYACQMPGGGC